MLVQGVRKCWGKNSSNTNTECEEWIRSEVRPVRVEGEHELKDVFPILVVIAYLINVTLCIGKTNSNWVVNKKDACIPSPTFIEIR
jgi:hypothetical protein